MAQSQHMTPHHVLDRLPALRPQRRPIRFMPEAVPPVRLAAFLFALSAIIGLGIWAVILSEIF